MDEFKFVYYNGKTRQNTYDGAFIYSRTKELSPEAMRKVYQIAKKAGMNPNQFCRIRNGCFSDESLGDPNAGANSNSFRGILASTKISELLGVEPVAARDSIKRTAQTAKVLLPPPEPTARHWWYEIGDYLERPHRHFEAMDSLRTGVQWPKQ